MKGEKRFVYLAEHPTEPLIKIGRSKQPFERAFMQKAKLLGLLREHTWLGVTYECQLHERFAHQKVRTEWFRDCNELRHFIFHSGAHGNLWTGMAKRQKAAVRAKG